jgi:UDP-glucose 4-epimerase
MNKEKSVLVTGGAGYIGSHIVLSCLDAGYKVIVIDKDKKACDHLIKCTKRRKKIKVFNADIDNDVYIDGIFTNENIGAVIHCAAYISVPESVDNPLKYYANNTAKTTKLLYKMKKHNINLFLFSSTAAVYGIPDRESERGITEKTPCKPINPYGESKLMVETILKRHSLQNPNFRYVSFRFFNVAGSDISNRVQDIHWKKKGNIVPKLLNSVLNKKGFQVFGTDYDTDDGSCVRDYIHPTDLATAHMLALGNDKLKGVYNLGSNKGNSVWEVIKSTVRVTDEEIEIEHAKRRKGDPPVLTADPKKFMEASGWEPSYTMKEIISTAYKAYKKVSK